jgi:excisionase family DNA binding protein
LGDLSIDQVAQLLGVSKDTIRRRIKSGEYQAEKVVGAYGEEWRLPEFQFNKAIEIKEAVPMAGEVTVPMARQVTVAELEQAMQRLMQNAANKAMSRAMQEQTTKIKEELQETKAELKEELREAKETIDILTERIDTQGLALNNHFQLVDERLRAIAEKNKKKSLWARIFS